MLGGETSFDKRDYGYAFAAFKGSTYLALVMAARGQLSPVDAGEFRKQVTDGIDIVPCDLLSSVGRQVIEDALDDIEMMAQTNFRPGE